MATSTNSTTASKPIYKVQPPAGVDGKAPAARLIRAPSRAQLLRHLARDYGITIATQDDMVDLLTGATPTRIEDAGDDAGDAQQGQQQQPAAGQATA